MGIKNKISNYQGNVMDSFNENAYMNDPRYIQDKLVEKWSRVPEIGKGIKDLEARKARNLATMLENQTRYMAKLKESDMASTFNGFSPENMLRLVRLTYPNSIRADLFTEFTMQTSHDSIKYAMPVYTDKSQWGKEKGLDVKFDKPAPYTDDIMYESTESRYVTEMLNTKAATDDTANVQVDLKDATGPFGEHAENYVDGATEIFVQHTKTNKRVVLAVQVEGGKLGVPGEEAQWLLNEKGGYADDDTMLRVDPKKAITYVDGVFTIPLETSADKGASWNDYNNGTKNASIKVVARYNSNTDLSGQYLGEVNITLKDYQFRPRALAIGVTWTQQTELILDTSYGISAEELLMDTASNEIKKSLDYQAVKYADKIQRTNGLATVKFNAEQGATSKDSYWHTAQNIGQAIGAVKAKIYNKLGRGGVTAIVGGMSAVNYLMLSQAWTDKGAQDAFGGYKAGEINGIPVFVVPDGIVADNELVTTWKNPTNETDVSIAIGILYPFFSTGVIQRKQLYKEGAIARYEDTQALNPLYLGRIKIDGIRELN